MENQTIAELITILTAEVGTLKSSVDEATAKLNKYGEEAEKNNEKAKESFDLAAVAIEAAGVVLEEYIREAAEGTAKIQAFRTGVGIMAAGMHESADAVNEAQEGIEALGYTELQSTTTVSRFLQAHLNLKQAVDVARIAMDYADTTGKSYDDTLNTITTSLISGNAMALRSLGITTNARKVYAEYAAQLGKTAMTLTDVERRQAILDVLMKSSTTVAGVHAAVMAQDWGQMERMHEMTDQASYSLGQYFVPALGLVSGVAANVATSFKNATPLIQGAVAAMAGFTALSVMGIGAVALGISGIPTLIAKVGTALTYLGTSGSVVLLGLAALIAATNAAFIIFEKNVDAANKKMTDYNRAVNEAKGITFATISDETGSDPRKALEDTKKLMAANEARLEVDKEMNAEMRAHLEYTNKMLNAERLQLEVVVATLPKVKERVLTMEDLVRAAMNYNISQKDFTENLDEVMRKEKMRADFEGLTIQQQITALKNLDRQFKLSAADRMVLAHKIADLEVQAEQEKNNRIKAIGQQFQAQLVDNLTASFRSMVNLFGHSTINMAQLWDDMINQMVTKLLSSAILDLLAFIFTGSGSGIFEGLFKGGGKKLFGFDNPQNDSMAEAMGGKWFSDALSNFSKGYVKEALTSEKTGPVFAAAAGGGGHNTVVHLSFPSVVNLQSPYQTRRAAIIIGDVLKKIGAT